MILAFFKKLLGLGTATPASKPSTQRPADNAAAAEAPRRRGRRGGRRRTEGDTPQHDRPEGQTAGGNAPRDAGHRDGGRGPRGPRQGESQRPPRQRREREAARAEDLDLAPPAPPTQRAIIDPNAPTYASFALHPDVQRSLDDAGFTHCTPIQAQTLPFALTGRDVAGQAQTGTGKTAAFLVSMFQTLLTRPPRGERNAQTLRGIVIAPTRELAVQIHNDAKQLGRHTGLRLACVFGGVDYDKQRKQFEDGVDVLIGTPGRIIDFWRQGLYDLRQIEVVVLDEADRMFDLGFIDDIRRLLRRMPAPAERQSMLFSATLSQRVLELAYEDMNNPELIRIEPDRVTADKVRQVIYFPAMEEKLPLLIGMLRSADAHRTMVFVNTRRMADRLEDVLRANQINAQAVSGDVPQNKRLRYLKEFHSGELKVLIATDVASRGLHIPDVSHVYNFDLPQDCADYVHRIGRTARAGADGDAISFGCEDYAHCLPEIEKYIGHTIPRGSLTAELMASDVIFPKHRPREDAPRRGGGGGGGGRGGPRRGGPPRGGRR
ncbi:MAG: hypothetical protein RL026_2379 [Pseudomonadota bacterium]|jgi:ATP-dependent RNA helicase RhlB